jgi:hypothetical protein
MPSLGEIEIKERTEISTGKILGAVAVNVPRIPSR